MPAPGLAEEHLATSTEAELWDSLRWDMNMEQTKRV